MKRYNLNPETRSFDWGEMSVITLGESGRGRYEALIPFHAPENAEYLELAETRSGKPKIVQSQNSEGWLALVSGAGCYTRGTYGSVYCLPGGRDFLQVIARGSGAFGAAGRIGTWNEFLVAIPENTFLWVRPAGGSHKRERYRLYFGEQTVSRVGKEEMEMFCESQGIAWQDAYDPGTYDALLDLSCLGVMSESARSKEL